MAQHFEPYRYQSAAENLCRSRGLNAYEYLPDYASLAGHSSLAHMVPVQIPQWQIVAREIHAYKILKDEMEEALRMLSF